MPLSQNVENGDGYFFRWSHTHVRNTCVFHSTDCKGDCFNLGIFLREQCFLWKIHWSKTITCKFIQWPLKNGVKLFMSKYYVSGRAERVKQKTNYISFIGSYWSFNLFPKCKDSTCLHLFWFFSRLVEFSIIFNISTKLIDLCTRVSNFRKINLHSSHNWP